MPLHHFVFSMDVGQKSNHVNPKCFFLCVFVSIFLSSFLCFLLFVLDIFLKPTFHYQSCVGMLSKNPFLQQIGNRDSAATTNWYQHFYFYNKLISDPRFIT